MVKDILFTGKEYEDAFKHIDELKDIANCYIIPNVPRESVLLKMLLVTFTMKIKLG